MADPNRSQTEPTYTPEKDVYETTADGRTIQKAVKGVPIPLSEAVGLGLIKEEKPKEAEAEKPKDQPGPQANKPAEGPQERK